MIRLITILMLLIASFQSILAQSVDLDPQYFKYSFVQLPRKPLDDPSKRSYYVISNTSKYDNNQIKKSVVIDGLTKNKSHGFLIIEVEEPFLRMNTAIIEEVKGKMDLENKTSPAIGYKVNYSYYIDTEFTVKDSMNNVLKKYKFKDLNRTAGKQETYRNVAEKYISKLNDPELTNAILNHLNEVIVDNVSADFGYTIRSGNTKLWILDSKKHPEYEGQQNAYKLINNSFSSISFDKPISEIKSKVGPAIAYFESVEGRFPGTEKKDRKIKYGAYYNLALLNYYLEDLDKSAEWCNKLIANDFDKEDGERFLRMCNDLKERMEINKINTCHLTVNSVNNYHKDEEMELVETEKKKLSKANDPAYSKAKVTFRDSSVIEGYLSKDWNSNFATLIRNMYVPREGKKDTLYDISTMQALTVEFENKTLYRSITIVIPLVLTCFARELYNEGRMKSYILDGHYVIFQHKEQKPIAMDELDWLISSNKLYKVLARDCGNLEERVEKKEFGKSEEKIINFCKAWDESCK